MVGQVVDASFERFGEFLLLRRLAQSLMAEVFVAIRLGDKDGRTVIVKRPKLGERASGESAQAILREAEVLAEVRAPTLVALEAKGEVAGLPYVAVEHVRGVAGDVLVLVQIAGDDEGVARARLVDDAQECVAERLAPSGCGGREVTVDDATGSEGTGAGNAGDPDRVAVPANPPGEEVV